MPKAKVRCLTATVRLYGAEDRFGRFNFSGAIELREVMPGENEGTEIIPALRKSTDRYLSGLMKRKKG